MVGASFEWSGDSPADAAKRLARLQKEMVKQLKDAATEIGLLILRTASRLVHVDTGNLRASLASEVQEVGKYAIKVVTGTNVSYASHQERMYPYLRPAIRKNEGKIEETVEKAQQKAVKNAS